MQSRTENIYYKLAPSQIPEWYAYQLSPESPVYNISFNHFFVDNINPKLFLQACQKVINRHNIFRIRIDYDTGNDYPIQFIGPEIVLDLKSFLIDKTYLSNEEIEAEQNNIAKYYSIMPFDFKNGSLFRLHLVEYPNQQFQLIFTVHHIIWDETSTINFIKELTKIYNTVLQGEELELSELTADYFTYVNYVNTAIADGSFDKHKNYWLDIFRTVPATLNLPEDYKRPALQTYHGNTIIEWLPQSVIRDAQLYLYKNNITLFIFLIALLDLYFYRITGQNDFVLGCPIAGRNHSDFKALLGCFAVPMPIRCQINKNMTFNDLLQHVKVRVLGAIEHHQYPCNELIEHLQHTKDLSRPKLFSVMAGIQNNKSEFLSINLGNNKLYAKDIYSTENYGARFDLAIGMDQLGSDIKLFCTYNVDIFKESTIQSMLKQIIYLISLVIADPNKNINNYSLLTDNQISKLISEIYVNDKQYPQNLTLHELIEQQIAKEPSCIAISYRNRDITYSDLNEKANRLARYLQYNHQSHINNIGIILDACPEMIISILAILKLGKCYVPINPATPIQRIFELIKSTKMECIISTSQHIELLEKALPVSITNLEKLDNDIINKFSSSNLNLNISSKSNAYIIYTSGTTGIPKGIPIQHAGVINLLTATQSNYHIHSDDIVLFNTTFTFDASILEIFWPFAFGAKIVIPESGKHKSPVLLGKFIDEQKVTIFQTVPAMLNELCIARKNQEISELPNLRLIICGGSSMTRQLRDDCFNVFNATLANHYGPTEVTVDATCFNCSNEFDGDIVPLGKSLQNIKIFILDDYLELVPHNVIGEIYIHSPGLTEGYINDPERNHFSFIEKQFSANMKPIRLYRTGDLGKYNSDGNIYFYGRRDNQIKINGNRVELGEIEATLAKHPNVKQAVVKFVNDKILAYVQPIEGINQFSSGGTDYFQFTLSQSPHLQPLMITAHLQTWPKYFAGSPAIKKYWHRVCVEYPEYQFCLLSSEGKVAAVCNGIPLFWDGTINNLPAGWDEGIERAFDQVSKGIMPNTVFGLTGIVTTEFQGKGLSTLIVKAFRSLAKMHGHTQFLGPVRPVGMLDHKTHDFENWLNTKDKNNEPIDHWLRTHQRIGAKTLSPAPQSQFVEGTIKEWQEWTGEKFEKSGIYFLPNTLQGVHIDIENNRGYYYDPTIWVAHYNLDKTEGSTIHLSKEDYRNFLVDHLPSYMVPSLYYFIAKMPMTENGKVNEQALPDITNTPHSSQVAPRNSIQKELVKLWQEVLNINSIGVTDDFFLLGGQSLQVIKMLSKIEQVYNITMPLKIFYKEPTILNTERFIREFLIETSMISKP